MTEEELTVLKNISDKLDEISATLKELKSNNNYWLISQIHDDTQQIRKSTNIMIGMPPQF